MREINIKAVAALKMGEILSDIHEKAQTRSQCQKVKVGSLIITPDGIPIAYGFNRCIPDRACIENGCHRIAVYGDDSKAHRGSGDCLAIHSEVDAISQCAHRGLCTRGATIFITRYPCENCAKAIVAAGIKGVIYGREQKISDATYNIFRSANVEVIHMTGLGFEDAEAPEEIDEDLKKSFQLAFDMADAIENSYNDAEDDDEPEPEEKPKPSIDELTPYGVLAAIREKFGHHAQICVCIEELNELACILAKFLRYEDETKGIAELHDKVLDEFVDVENILQHVQSIFQFSGQEITLRADKKIDRLRRWLKNDDSIQDTLSDRKLD